MVNSSVLMDLPQSISLLQIKKKRKKRYKKINILWESREDKKKKMKNKLDYKMIIIKTVLFIVKIKTKQYSYAWAWLTNKAAKKKVVVQTGVFIYKGIIFAIL